MKEEYSDKAETYVLTDIKGNVAEFEFEHDVISMSYNSDGNRKSLMLVIDNPSQIDEISLDDISNIMFRRKYILYNDTNHFDSSSNVISNENLVISHMHDEDAHFNLRVYQQGNCYASTPLIDIPLNYSSRNSPYITSLDPTWNIFLVRNVRQLKLIHIG